MEIQHVSHKHPLILSEVKNDCDGAEIFCYGCKQKITSRSAYRCRNCFFFLHKFCAELPKKILKHPMHPEHPLALLPRAPYRHPEFGCNACKKRWEGFTYHCSICEFDLDVSCAGSARRFEVEHKSHKHPLTLVFRQASFKCDACGTKHDNEGFSYMCSTCIFWIHEDCASLPTTFKHHVHVHRLHLAYSFPNVGFFNAANFVCRVCGEKLINIDYWLYQCNGCRYFVHLQCSTKKVESKDPKNIEDTDVAAESLHLQLPDNSVNLIDQFVKQMSMEDDNNNRSESDANQLNHFSHNHPLTLCSFVNSDDNLCSRSQLSILNDEHNENKICNACIRPISAPSFYSCSPCNFFLHKWCAELPNELHHPCHPHPIILLQTSPEPDGFFWCYSCVQLCNGFSYRCTETECRGGYHLDVKCASLPRSIVHEAHEHPLFLRQSCLIEGCAACDESNMMLSFGCGTCNFNLHYQCALLPRTIKHRYDKHPFSLTYAPIKDGPDEYICEFCEKEIDPKWWFYHCIDCDQSACAKCFYKNEKEFPAVKLGSKPQEVWPGQDLGSTGVLHLLSQVRNFLSAISSSSEIFYKFPRHPHILVAVEGVKECPSCAKCHGDILNNTQPAFKCLQCNIAVHAGCALDFLIPLSSSELLGPCTQN